MSNKTVLDEYNRAVDDLTRVAGALGMQEEEGFPPLPRLNIGGQEFQTKLSVLRSQPGSLLSAVFVGEEECEYDEQGRFFFDHDPTFFHNILNFMRTGDCTIPYERGPFEHFRKQVEYWRLEVLEARCEVHYEKYIKPFVVGDKSARAGKGPNGRLVYAKATAEQKKLYGALATKLIESVHASLMEGAGAGHICTTLTSYRPPELAGRPGLPLWKNPDNWAIAHVTYCWDPSLACFFAPVGGMGALVAASEYLVTSFAEKGFLAAVKPDASGYSYEVSGMAA